MTTRTFFLLTDTVILALYCLRHITFPDAHFSTSLAIATNTWVEALGSSSPHFFRNSGRMRKLQSFGYCKFLETVQINVVDVHLVLHIWGGRGSVLGYDAVFLTSVFSRFIPFSK